MCFNSIKPSFLDDSFLSFTHFFIQLHHLCAHLTLPLPIEIEIIMSDMYQANDGKWYPKTQMVSAAATTRPDNENDLSEEYSDKLSEQELTDQPQGYQQQNQYGGQSYGQQQYGQQQYGGGYG
jgi:hypothetical protein